MTRFEEAKELVERIEDKCRRWNWTRYVFDDHTKPYVVRLVELVLEFLDERAARATPSSAERRRR